MHCLRRKATGLCHRQMRISTFPPRLSVLHRTPWPSAFRLGAMKSHLSLIDGLLIPTISTRNSRVRARAGRAISARRRMNRHLPLVAQDRWSASVLLRTTDHCQTLKVRFAISRIRASRGVPACLDYKGQFLSSILFELCFVWLRSGQFIPIITDT